MKRFREYRKDQATRDKYADVALDVKDFIYPYFVVEGEGVKEEINTMPGVFRFSIDTLALERWQRDLDIFMDKVNELGAEVIVQNAGNSIEMQNKQLMYLLSQKVDSVVILAKKCDTLSDAVQKFRAKNIPVIAYDRLLMNSDAVSYYATFDNYMVGTVQGQYIVDTLDLDNAAGPFNLEITAGDPGDNNAGYFFNGAYDVLKPYIESGKLNVVSGQKTFDECATPLWATETSQSRAENILSSNYSDGTNVDDWLCSNDSTALGVENALAANYNGTYPIVTGQDCDVENVKNIISGKGYMALVAVILGRYHPLAIFGCAMVIGFAESLQFFLQTRGVPLPSQAFSMVPYVIAVVVLLFSIGCHFAPAALGKPYERDKR